MDRMWGGTFPVDARTGCLGPKLGTRERQQGAGKNWAQHLPLGFLRGRDLVLQFSKPSSFPTSISRKEVLAEWGELGIFPAHPLKTERETGCQEGHLQT